MLLRILIATLVVVVLFYWLKRNLKHQLRPPKRAKAQPAKPAQKTQTLVICHVCGVHIPSDQGHMRGNHYYCPQHG